MAVMTTPERTEASTTAGERDMLEGWLEFHRETLAQKCAGLTDEQLRETAVPPSELSLLGLVRHMAEVEQAWFRNVLANEQVPPLYYTDEDRDGDFHVTDQDTWAEAEASWRDAIARARELAAPRSLDDLGEGKHRRGDINLRWIYVHMIEEYARHNGHADLLRERIDGTTGD
ncbi:DinB family protein [Streptomyces spiramyceticus]|uniref:DinB family protein n=1 Tax=Streptomyces spiramyceticus TaxID=299717 RepID=UPI003B75B95A